ncbi:MAG: DEAD/DEAH box helicase [Chloroflexota bacterium]|nr:DEAD/DEAH box helicase [Chloroflexota bacterium]
MAEQHRFFRPVERIEPGRLDPPAGDRVGHPSAQDLLLRAYRLSLLHGSAPLLSLQRSRVIPTTYQLVPVLMALESPRVRLLLADDVGLGKSIEAGLVITELMARQLASRVLIITPANLREQWREALLQFFHLEARIVSARHRRELERQLPAGANPWKFFPILITSVDYAKQPGVRAQIAEQPWDIVLFDEAHAVAKPHQRDQDHAVEMDRWQLARQLAPLARHLLLLTATPHNGYSDSFASLLRLLDVGAVAGPEHDPVIDRDVARRHVCQRRRQDVKTWFEQEGRRSPFPARDAEEEYVTPSEAERRVSLSLDGYASRMVETAVGGRRRTLASWAALHLHKRALSSPHALACSLRNRRAALLGRMAVQGEEPDDVAALPLGVAIANAMDEDTGERFAEAEAEDRVERTFYGDARAIQEDLVLLDQVLKQAQAVTPERDAKLQHLIRNTLRQRFRTHPRAIIFTRYRDTLTYLEQQLGRVPRFKTDGLTIVTIHGGLSETQRRERFQQFEEASPALLIATDAISEGINLQHACAQVIHYELPWNPNRLEQRNGRVDRFGQPQPTVYVRTLVTNDTLEAVILRTLVQKAERIRSDYGFSPPFFGDDASVVDLIREQGVELAAPPQQLGLFDAPVSLSQRKAAAVEIDPFAGETLDRIQEESYYGQTGVSLPDIERRLQETEERLGSPQQIADFVLSGLRRFNCHVTETRTAVYRLDVRDAALRAGGVPEVIEAATFDPTAALNDLRLEAIDLGHPLVRRLVERVKQATFLDREHYGRTTALVTSDVSEVTALLHALARFVVETQPRSIVEELVEIALPVYGDAPLPSDAATKLLRARHSTETRTEAEAQEDLAEVLTRPDLDAVVQNAVEERRLTLVAERRRMKDRLDRTEVEQRTWLVGIDRMTAASCDLLAVTVLYPA